MSKSSDLIDDNEGWEWNSDIVGSNSHAISGEGKGSNLRSQNASLDTNTHSYRCLIDPVTIKAA